MALTKETVVDRIEILEDGQVQIRQAIRIKEDGVILSESFHRKVLAPGDDYSQEDKRVSDVCGLFHTTKAISDYAVKIEANKIKK